MRRDDKEACKRIALRSLSALMLLFTSSTGIVGQTVESDKSVVVPDQAMEQIVRRVLGWYFKPRNQSKVIYLDEQGLQKSWLPTIKNIEFRLLSAEDLQKRGRGVYFFTEPERSGTHYQIGFAFGYPYCKFIGDSWHFRISKQKIGLWQGDGIGGDCSSGIGY
jgi:hypothetical protein